MLQSTHKKSGIPSRIVLEYQNFFLVNASRATKFWRGSSFARDPRLFCRRPSPRQGSIILDFRGRVKCKFDRFCQNPLNFAKSRFASAALSHAVPVRFCFYNKKECCALFLLACSLSRTDNKLSNGLYSRLNPFEWSIAYAIDLDRLQVLPAP